MNDDELRTAIAALRLAWLHSHDEVEGKTFRELEEKLRGRLKTDYSAELWIDDNDEVNLNLHFRHGDFPAARKALIRFRDIVQGRIDSQRNCPYFEE